MSNVIQRLSRGDYDNRVDFGNSDEQRKAYRAEDRRIRQQFRADIELEFGLEDHPKADLLWDMAWGRGHSCGFLDIYHEYAQLSDLVK